MIGYRCIACATTQDADFDGFVCPDCGSNLDIEYDYDEAVRAFPGVSRGGPRDIFDYAAVLPAFPDRSFPLRIGATPMYQSKRLGAGDRHEGRRRSSSKYGQRRLITRLPLGGARRDSRGLRSCGGTGGEAHPVALIRRDCAGCAWQLRRGI